jgi:hypothetical protein
MRTPWSIMLFTFTALASCGDQSACLAPLDLDCAPLYEPTFDNVHSITFSGKCSLGGTSCHGSSGNKGGLSFSSDVDTAYDALTSSGRVDTVQPECSILLQRLLSSLNTEVMPPGNPLPESELCAIKQWIAAGAPR